MQRCTSATEHAQAKIIGRILRELRTDLGMSLHAAAEHSRRPGIEARPIGYSVLGSYERGERMVSIDRLVELARIYDVAPGVLISVIERRIQNPSLSGLAVVSRSD